MADHHASQGSGTKRPRAKTALTIFLERFSGMRPPSLLHYHVRYKCTGQWTKAPVLVGRSVGTLPVDHLATRRRMAAVGSGQLDGGGLVEVGDQADSC